MCGDNGGVDGDEPVIAPDGRGLPGWWRRYLWWVDPRTWGIPVRSAIAAAAVVLVSFVIVGAAVAAVLYRQLLADVDSAADQRTREVVTALQSGPVDELDGRLLATNGQIVAVQILDASGAVVRATPGIAAAPMTGPGTMSRPSPPSTSAEGDEDVRVREQSTDDTEGGYTVVVKSANGAVRSTVRNVAVLLAAAMPFVVGGATAATFVLVRRSLRSVEAIRTQVADISAQDLSGRVPVPAHRDEISALATTMNDMLARVESGQAAQRRFVGDASHELRSPLATIISAVEIGLTHPELSQEQLARELVLPEAQRMQALIDDLLLLARSDERGIVLRRSDVDLDDLAAQEVGRLDREGVRTVRADLLPARVVGDPQALSRVLRNLVDNAVRHARSVVEVAVWIQDGSACLSVADDGPGIPAADRARVFERFVRLDTDRSRAGGGSGLGLAIVAEIVAAHGGSVIVADRSGGGTVITVQLPVDFEASR